MELVSRKSLPDSSPYKGYEFGGSIYWDTNKGKYDLGFFSIVFTTPDKEKHELGGYHIKVIEMIQNTIE